MSLPIFLLVITASFFHALWNFGAKKVSGDINVFWLSLCVSAVMMTIPGWYFGLPQGITANTLILLLINGGVMSCYFICLAKAYTTGEISMVYPTARGLGVLGTAMLAIVLLGEEISVLAGFGIAAIISGILLVGLRNARKIENSKALTYALIAGCCIAAYSLFAKVLIMRMPPITFSFFLQIMQLIGVAPAVFLTEERKHLGRTWKTKKKYIFLIGLSSPLVYVAILYALQQAPVSYVISIRETAIIFGALLGFIFLREKMTLGKIFGIIAIVIGSICIKIS